jgi:spoIIIJ-associated protein
MEPMNAFERRIVHCALAERNDIITDSRGEEPYRCVVIKPAG